MLKELFEYIVGMARPTTIAEHGRIYSTVPLTLVNEEPDVAALSINSLEGLIEYVQSKFDTDRPLMIQVKSPTEVFVFDALNHTHDRRYYLKAAALLPKIIFNDFVEREAFQIALQASFVPGAGTQSTVLALVSKMTINNGVGVEDDGVTQRVNVKNGIDFTLAEVPERVSLAPFRTFVEVDQPLSDFVFRTREGRQGIECALFEADGGVWKLTAMQRINSYLQQALEDEIATGAVTIIS